jgi:hypothetical protein
MKQYEIKIDGESYLMTRQEIQGILNDRASRLFFKTIRQGGEISFPFEAIKAEYREEVIN